MLIEKILQANTEVMEVIKEEIAYKYIVLENSVLVVLNNFDDKDKVNITMSFHKNQNDEYGYIVLNNRYYIPLYDDFLDNLLNTETLVIGVSPYGEYKIDIKCSIDLDKFTLGKISALIETINALTTTKS